MVSQFLDLEKQIANGNKVDLLDFKYLFGIAKQRLWLISTQIGWDCQHLQVVCSFGRC